MAVKPVVCRGVVPDHYRGPLYYRRLIFNFRAGKKPLERMLSFEDRALKQRLANVSFPRAAWRNAPELCDANGELLPELRTPLKAKMQASANRSWDEFSAHSLVLVSARIRDVIEAIAPSVHYFVPIDVADHDGGNFRVYAFYCGVTRPDTALAMEANGITRMVLANGGQTFEPPLNCITQSDRFAYLDPAVLAGAPLLYDPMLAMLFSHELVEQLGDCMPKGEAFVPMGLLG